jgi:hypothetical protein
MILGTFNDLFKYNKLLLDDDDFNTHMVAKVLTRSIDNTAVLA